MQSEIISSMDDGLLVNNDFGRSRGEFVRRENSNDNMPGGWSMCVRFTWYGHSTIGLEIDEYKILIDPYFNDNPAATIGPDDVQADYILVTHGHADHVGDTVSIANRTGALVIANPEISKWLKARGVKTHAQQVGGGYQHPFGHVKMTHAEHSSPLPDGSYGGVAVGFLITLIDGRKIYLAGDTGLFGDMRYIGDEGLTLAVLPIGGNFTMGPVDALKAVNILEPEYVIPVHYDTWEIINQDARVWCSLVESQTNVTPHFLHPGEGVVI